jgi:hypothetical protein
MHSRQSPELSSIILQNFATQNYWNLGCIYKLIGHCAQIPSLNLKMQLSFIQLSLYNLFPKAHFLHLRGLIYY